jgi:hypothetical protein
MICSCDNVAMIVIRTSLSRLKAILEAARQQIHQGEGLRHEVFWREMVEDKSRKRRARPKGLSRARLFQP